MGETQTHPVNGAEAVHDHCGAKRAGWVHGAASEVDLDREREVARRVTCLSTLKGLVFPRVTQKFRGSTRSLTQVSWFLGWRALHRSHPMHHSFFSSPVLGLDFLPPLQLPLTPIFP